ncbi:hypothetical protein SODALDRAFT_343571 [Sodiomyces alkalinus F11]|uniref:Protein CMS1 n=1 Tax=Sodiomyces alkalinus (strain CBS 110278 / VKM F-3762 / F11) TaxID=1314773 RepID=A0A3N2Q4Z6_SODAK|nr:hypothetical protein SODALDRAFT_343571 [Sodiomyces alkalinus F11]ROT41728.1 hypothetical protein SODALDRAFT_343571 [Sodiomyces alkalinus F11]
MSKSKKRAAPSEEGSRKPKKQKKSPYQVDESLLNVEAGINESFAVMDSQLLADYTAQKITRFGSDLSSIEVADLTISANAIMDTTSWQSPRTMENLAAFLEKFAERPERLSTAPEVKGSPHTIIVTGAGLRAADLVRAARKFQGEKSKVAKLFAKHMKIEEQTKFLQTHRTGIAVGTPARLMDLVDNGALSVAKLERIVVDVSHIDGKKRGVMDMKDTMLPLARWLTRKEFKERYAAEKKPLALLFY